MKNIIVYILGLLFFISCDAFDDIVSNLDENEAELESNYYIQEGWNSFQTQDFSEAAGFFNYIISNSNNPDSTNQDVTAEILFDAYHGFAWSNLLFSNTLYGDNNEEERFLFRDTSYDSFFVSDSILNGIDYSSEVFDYECDILAGKHLIYRRFTNLVLPGRGQMVNSTKKKKLFLRARCSYFYNCRTLF